MNKQTQNKERCRDLNKYPFGDNFFAFDFLKLINFMLIISSGLMFCLFAWWLV